jgi:hypothetical protein
MQTKLNISPSRSPNANKHNKQTTQKNDDDNTERGRVNWLAQFQTIHVNSIHGNW